VSTSTPKDYEQAISVLINATITPQIITVGAEKTSVIIIDDLLVNTEELIKDACNNASFMPVRDSYYPGLRAQLPPLYVTKVLQAVCQGIRRVYQIPPSLNLQSQSAYYSLITTLEKDLHPMQQMPHFDTNGQYNFAILHYLNANYHGDTGFFRHLPTGFERIDKTNVKHYFNAAQKFINENELPVQEYCKASTPHYALLQQIAYKPNRLVIYPGNLLHSTLVCPDNDIDANPATGRLTANIFIDFK
jgi:hypothetical protein